uniref:Ribonuclease n=1 Tax=Branchiostoma floridae TaxID=7739 RepID=C3ZGG4_BRAFL|eukprot:XP_002592334.1 hypothetical protein BRAFLDRAFT_285333 [Branchiostoma floridae]
MDLCDFETDNTKSCVVGSEVPDVTKGEPCCLGIDEAGRGPVLGPMVYGICYCPLSGQDRLKDMGFADSKTLTEEQREKLFEAIAGAGEFMGWTIHILAPNAISNCMLRRSKYNLNTLSHDTAIGLIQRTLDSGVNLQEVYVDTVGDATKYQDKLKGIFPDLDITVTPKADAKFPIVSAASICAKVARDRAVKGWTFFEEKDGNTISRKFGSGYPSDPETKKWLASMVEPVFGFPQFVRFSWSTASKILDDKAVPVNWDDEDEDEKAATPSVMSFFAAKGEDPKQKKHQYFQERFLHTVTDFGS